MIANKKGFTLLELILVVIIVAVLAAMAIPMMTGSADRARRAEAVAALGAIRTAERLYYVEHSAYTAVVVTGWGASGPLAAYISATDLNGKFFTSGCYSVALVTGPPAAFSVKCDSSLSAQPAGVGLGVITMDINGGTTGY